MGFGVENAMKTPSVLLLALAAALPSLAAADPQPPAGRCDGTWLAAAHDLAAKGYSPKDDAKYLTTETVAGGSRQVVDIANAPKLCDATVWHYLAVKEPAGGDATLDAKTGKPVAPMVLKWRDEAVKTAWSQGLASQLEILIGVNDLYKEIDPKGRDVLAKGDAVVDAAVKLGVAARKDAPSPSKLAEVGLASAGFAAEKAYEVAPVEGKGSTDAAQIKAALSALLKDSTPAAPKKGAKPAAPTLLLGPGVLAFRQGVIELAGKVAAKAKGASYKPVAWGAASAAAAADDKAYQAALSYLTDPAIKDAADDSVHEKAALSAVDYALRNLLAQRAAGVDASVAAARKMLKGTTVAAALAGVAHDATVDPAKVPVPPKGSLAAEVLEKLKGTDEYSELSKIYDNNKNNSKGVEAKAQMARMEADAAATTVGKVGKTSALQFTIGGQKVTDTGILVADLTTDKDYRSFIANSVAQNIAGDGKLQAALAALRGQGDSGTVITPPLKPDQQAPAADLPKPPAKAPPPEPSAWDALVKATPSAGFFGFFSSAETAERYVSHQNESAAAIASDAARARNGKEAELNRNAAAAQRAADAQKARDLADAAAKAKADEDRIRRTPMDPDLSAAEAARIQNEQIAAREKAAAERKAAIEKAAADAKAQRAKDEAAALKAAQDAAAKAKAESDAKLKALDDTVNKAYDDGIAKAEAALHLDYKKPGSDRRDAAERESGYTGSFYRLERVDKYFGDNWEGASLPKAAAACKTKLGFKMPVGNGAGFKDPSADNVDGMCGVHGGLVGYLSSFRGSVKGAATPAKK
jgi:hypothetical protein